MLASEPNGKPRQQYDCNWESEPALNIVADGTLDNGRSRTISEPLIPAYQASSFFESRPDAAESADAASLLAGKEATLKLLLATMQRFGIEELDPEGVPFDPEYHEAMTMQPSDTAEPGSVLTVVQKGYSLNGRLLRPARVVVAAEVQPPERR